MRFPQLRHFPQPLALAAMLGWRKRSPIFTMGKIRRKFEVDFKRQLIAQIEAGQEVVIVDLRHGLEIEQDGNKLPGALHIRPEELDRRHTEIPRDRDVVLYCS